MQAFILLLPLIGAAIIGLGGLISPGFRQQKGLIGTLGTLAVAIPFGLILWARLGFDPEKVEFSLFGLSWMQAGGLEIDFAYRLDELGILMGMIVTGVGSLIHLYSIGYMQHDAGFWKFFAYLNLFIFAMLNLVLGDNMVVMFLGWEGVGLCSYLLIGFWYSDMNNSKAAQKAFIANRIGDFAMLIAMFIVYRTVGSFDFQAINGAAAVGDLVNNSGFWIALLVFIAATGKSAQIPLFVWLPDAMAGPTPVSALIHAATMVTSGIYLIARMAVVFGSAPAVLVVIAVVAAATALIAALIAIAQNDIKKVLAYSTVSQLGFMFMALGAGAYTAALFHVMTHAFFKACLFLGSGSVIHGMEHLKAKPGLDEHPHGFDPQDVRHMGGLRRYMPATGTTFWIATLAISGIPLLAGFFSKDEILASSFFAGYENVAYFAVWGVGVFTAFLTAFYMTRLSYLTFEGKERFREVSDDEPHESPATMTLPLWILAILSVVGGLVGLPYVIGHGELHWLNHWLEGATLETEVFESYATVGLEIGLILLSSVIAIAGVLIGRNYYRKHGLAGDAQLQQRLGGLYESMRGKFYFDELYDAIIVRPYEWFSRNVARRFDDGVVDGVVNGTGTAIGGIGEAFRRLQTGVISNYALILSIGVVLVLAWLIS